MGLLKFIHIPTLFISFSLGLFLAYSFGPSLRDIVVYPSQDVMKTIEYQDKSGQCFEFDMVGEKCPLNPDLIHQIPIQA